MKYYAVHAGKKPGIYSNWNDCKSQIDGFSKPIFKKFENIKDAELFLKNGFSLETKKGFSNNFKHNIDKKNEKKLEDLLNEQDNRIFVYSDGSCIKFKNGIFKAGYGMDNYAGVIFKNGKPHKVVSLGEEYNSYFVSIKNGEIVEEKLEAVILK